MGRQREREQRRTVALTARLRSNQGWFDVTIGNVSSRGMLLRGSTLPSMGEFIEVRQQSVSVIGRVVWSHGANCGIRTQDAVDISSLLSTSVTRRTTAKRERRRAPRPATVASSVEAIARRVEASKRFARIFDWSLVAIGGALVAAAITDAAYSALRQPMEQARLALEQSHRDEPS
jgi:hypothetical protein